MLQGASVTIRPGQTILDVAAGVGVEIPTLCHDPRLEPAGACRLCLVEIDGWPRLAPACATIAQPGMVVATENARIERHRRSLLALYLTDHAMAGDGAAAGAPDELLALAKRHGAPTDWGRMAPCREPRPDYRNPYIHFDPARCILCAQCTRYCSEVEGVSAITLAGRGPETTISTVDRLSLLDTTCELCGGCIDVCPTGAMTEKLPLVRQQSPDRSLKQVRTTCGYCGVGCQLDLNVDPDANDGRGAVIKVTSPAPGTTTNDGNLCVKGRFGYDFIDHPDRLRVPLVRGTDGALREASWDAAIEAAAGGLLAVKARHGADALGFVSSSRCTVEENYLTQKLARAVFGTNNVHQCAAT